MLHPRKTILWLAARIALRLLAVGTLVPVLGLGLETCLRGGSGAAAFLCLPLGCLLAAFVACLILYCAARTAEDIQAVRTKTANETKNTGARDP